MDSISVLNLDGTNRNVKDAGSVHTVSINGTSQTVSGNHVDLDVDSRIETIVNQIPIFNINFVTGELMYAEGPYTFSINTTSGNLEWEVSA